MQAQSTSKCVGGHANVHFDQVIYQILHQLMYVRPHLSDIWKSCDLEHPEVKSLPLECSQGLIHYATCVRLEELWT